MLACMLPINSHTVSFSITTSIGTVCMLNVLAWFVSVWKLFELFLSTNMHGKINHESMCIIL